MLLALALLLGTGCATSSYHAEESAREQRAADELRRLGAGEAGSAAQQRADAHRRQASCGDFLECVVDALLSLSSSK